MTPEATWSAASRCIVLDDPRPVQVRHHDAWVGGVVTAQRRDSEGVVWVLVRYYSGPGIVEYRRWAPAADLRSVGEPHSR